MGDGSLVGEDFLEAVDDYFILWQLGSMFVTIAKNRLHSCVMCCFNFLHGVGDKKKIAWILCQRFSNFSVALRFRLRADACIEEGSNLWRQISRSSATEK